MINPIAGRGYRCPTASTGRARLFTCLAGCVASVPSGLAFGLQPLVLSPLGDGRSRLALALCRLESFALGRDPNVLGVTFSRDAGLFGNTGRFPLGQTSLSCSTHGRPRLPPLDDGRIVRIRPFQELGDHCLLGVLGGAQPLAEFFCFIPVMDSPRIDSDAPVKEECIGSGSGVAASLSKAQPDADPIVQFRV